jgi:DNA processing protein
LARSLGRELSEMGIAVVSGLARGIDSAAHRGGLQGPGGTVAVIGTGLDVPYPRENAGLLLDVASNGCAITEQWMGGPPVAFVFPLRNRLISAMSYAVIVVEAGARSGALITAKWALEQGREVGAVPGFPGEFRSVGVNRLLKQGAFVVEKAADILAAVPVLGLELEVRPAAEKEQSDAARAGEDKPESSKQYVNRDLNRVLSALSKTPAGVDDLSAHVGLAVAEVQRYLFHLEMSGQAERDCMGRYTKMRI